jgi:hypothetical protein
MHVMLLGSMNRVGGSLEGPTFERGEKRREKCQQMMLETDHISVGVRMTL